MAAPASVTRLGLMPIPRTPLIGRETERATARALLLDEAVPLLTLTGPGGIGKTRLALAIADEVAPHFTDGVVWVDLAPLGDPALIATTLARILGLSPDPNRSLADELVRHLHPRQTLLLIDNCEHLLAAAADLMGTLLTGCPALQVLATSRAPLRLRGEQELPVPPLSPGDDRAPGEAVALFVQRARAVRAGFTLDTTTQPVVAEICRRLDGLPLAIELAASWIRLLPPGALLERLTQRVLDVPGGARDLPSRQQTLRQTIAWSHELLGDEERLLFRRLGVFAGGFDLEAAVAITREAGEPGADLLSRLAALIDQSLLLRDGEGGGRFTMLETIRQYARERLASSAEEPAVRAAHAGFFLALAEQAEPHLRGPEQTRWLARLERDHSNFRDALHWYWDQGHAAAALRLAGALGSYWEARRHVIEGRQWLETLLPRADAAIPAAARAKALSWGGTLAWMQGDFATARERHQAALAAYEAAGDARGVAFSLNCLGAQALMQDQLDEAETPIREALRRYEETGDAWGMGFTLLNIGVLAQQRGELEAAEQAIAESLTHYRVAGDPNEIAYALVYLGSIARARGDSERAQPLVEAGIAQLRESGDAYRLCYGLATLGAIHHDRGDPRAAVAAFIETLALCRDLGDRLGYAQSFEWLAPSLLSLGMVEQSVRLLATASTIRTELGAPLRSGEALAVEPVMVQARGILGEARVAATWTMGLTLTPERVVVDVLDPAFVRREPDEGAPAIPAADAHPVRQPVGSDVDLTPREREILGLLTQRLTDLEIAQQLFISPKTAGHHVSNILGKLQATNRREAAAIAVRSALV